MVQIRNMEINKYKMGSREREMLHMELRRECGSCISKM